MLMSEMRAERLLGAIDPAVRASLSPEQEAAIRAAVGTTRWSDHPVDLRLSLPMPGLHFYMALVGGRERRSRARLRHERRLHPLVSLGNVAIFTGLTLVLGLGLIGAAALAGGVVAF